jgi:hypothetical protein
MSKLLFVESKDGQKQIVYGQHNKPLDIEDGVTKEVLERNILVDYALEKPQAEPGKEFVLYVNPQTKEQWYEAVEVPLSVEEQLQQEIGNILFESAMDKARIAELEASQGDMLVEIAMLKMRGDL